MSTSDGLAILYLHTICATSALLVCNNLINEPWVTGLISSQQQNFQQNQQNALPWG